MSMGIWIQRPGGWRRGRLALAAGWLLTGVPAVVGGELLPDDHGNTAASATPLYGTSNTVSGEIDYDTDVDVFTLPLEPAVGTLVQVHTGTVRDVEITFLPPALSPSAVETNSAWNGSPLSLAATNPGAASQWILIVNGLFHFTTGTYTLSVWDVPGQDTDGDGLADTWEQTHFGSLSETAGGDADGDGASNAVEYRAQTNPTNRSDAVVVKSHDLDVSGAVRLGWDQAAHATYDVYSATNVNGPWSFRYRHTAGNSASWMLWTNTGASADAAFFRLEFDPSP